MRLIIVTGGAGFIGSNLVRELNNEGYSEIIIIDNLCGEKKWKNLVALRFVDFIDYKLGIERVIEKINSLEIDFFFHIGANTNVLEKDVDLMIHQNFEFSKAYLKFALNKKVPFIYASSSAVYGNSNCFIPDNNCEKPHNIYALSKLLFDNYVRFIIKSGRIESKIIGLRFFNVYGMGEHHKGANASLPHRFYEFIKTKGFIDLFEGAENIRRDYIWVKDLTKTLILATDEAIKSGIYNLGSGQTLSHKEVAGIVIEVLQEEGIISGESGSYIKYVKFPENLKKQFQFYTKAECLPTWLKRNIELTPPDVGIRNYVRELVKHDFDE